MSRPTVLVVDDNDDARSTLAWLLQDAGFDTLEAGTGTAALHLAAGNPDLIVLDVVLPDTNGLEVLQRLRANPATAVIPVLMLSGRAVEVEDQVLGLEGGADAYLTKPADTTVLVAHLNALLRVRRAEDKLRRSEERYRVLAETIPEVVWAARADGRVEQLNQRWEEYTGVPLEAGMGDGWYDVVHPDDVPPTRARWATCVRTGDPYHIEYRLRRRDGAYRWHVGRAVPVHNGGGRIARWVGTCTDIDDQRRAADLLAWDALLLASVRDSVIVTDLNGIVTYWNEGATRLFGWSAAEMVGRPLTHRVPPAARPRMAEATWAIAAGRTFAGEWEDYRKDGTRVWIDARASRFDGPDGRPAGILGIAHDVTQRKRLEQQLGQASKMEAVGRLAAGVAHDFNNLLTVILGFGDVALQNLPAGHPARAAVNEVVRAGERAVALTRQLLAFGRQAAVAPRTVDLNAVVSDTERMLYRLVGADIALNTALQPGLGPVWADPGQLEQVLLNLAVNARDAMPRGGRLTLETRDVSLGAEYALTHPDVRPGPYVLLAVTDTGVGMTPEVLARIWEPFFTTKGPGEGTGLGLATVHGIVTQAGGHVAVVSEPGAGTTFNIYLPRSGEDDPPARTEARAAPSSPRGSETILLAEDEDAVRVLGRHVLEAAGYAVLEASDGAEAVRLAGEHAGPIDLLVSDLVMPGMGGRELAEVLTAARPGLKVLYVSGYADDERVRDGLRSGRVHYLEKPFLPSALARKVREVLDAS